MSRKQTTVIIDFQCGQFTYGRSHIRPVNQMIAIRQALQKSLQEQVTHVGCFSWFKSKRRPVNPLAGLEPKNMSFYQQASEKAILQKALTVILIKGLYDRRTIQLFLEITKHPFYQQVERDYQHENNNFELGLLSNCCNRKSIVFCFSQVFSQLGYQFIFPEIKSSKKKRQKLRSPLSPLGVYMRGFS